MQKTCNFIEKIYNIISYKTERRDCIEKETAYPFVYRIDPCCLSDRLSSRSIDPNGVLPAL